jgi:hypothetical protein
MTRTSTRPDLDRLITVAAASISVPKAAPADSFVLHAPLELLARAQLLAYVPSARVDDAAGMIEWLRTEYDAAGEPVATPAAQEGEPRPAALLAAIAAGDLDAVDALAAAWLPQLSGSEVCGALAEALAPSLSAAGHAPIAMSLLLRDPTMPTTLLRGPLRALATHPDWRLTWHAGVQGVGDPAALYGALRAAPHLGRPGSDFIHPLMSQAEQSGCAARILGPILADHVDAGTARRILGRVAAWSMLHDDPEQAPYGWSHALTMPQAVLMLAGRGVSGRTALAVASTFALGFRLAHGRTRLPERIEPVSARVSAAEVAAAAALHRDAHLVKYTLACLHAAADDPEFAGLHINAAARLVEWWRVEDARSSGVPSAAT